MPERFDYLKEKHYLCTPKTQVIMEQLIYPVGEQDFPNLRKRNMVYIDKTEFVYRLASLGGYFFLSRPRRFGKSLLISTLEAYFAGRKELFHDLAIEKLEKEWTAYPVLRLDMSSGKYAQMEYLHSALDLIFENYEKKYNVTRPEGASYGSRLSRLIDAAHDRAGRPVVVLVDEYDAPMLDCLDDEPRLNQVRNLMRDLYSPLKAQAAKLRFVFLTGITKFSQMSIFSELNNLVNLSMHPDFDGICGITAEEMETQMHPGIEALAEYHRCSTEQMLYKLKELYDGYHFSKRMTDVYNPFSLITAFQYKEMNNYWFGSGTPTWLLGLMKQYDVYLPSLDEVMADSESFNRPAERIDNPIPVLYQSGYLTIKDYDSEMDLYTLGVPNKEVRVGLAKSILTYIQAPLQPKAYLQRAYHQLAKDDDIAAFMPLLKDFFSSIPYDIANDNERHFQALLYAVLASYGADVRAEDRTSDGRVDILLKMPRAIYVVELKYGQTAAEAMEQLQQKNYVAKYRHDGRPLHLLGINISKETRTIDDWKCE